MALSVLSTIADEIEARFGVRRLAILHRTGEVPLVTASVLIAVAAEHRGAAFDACRYAIDELKARAPIWKQERFADGSVWIGRRPQRAEAVALAGSREPRRIGRGTWTGPSRHRPTSPRPADAPASCRACRCG